MSELRKLNSPLTVRRIPPQIDLGLVEKVIGVRHYGATAFNKYGFLPVEDVFAPKPIGGLWTSPVHTDNDWKDCDPGKFCGKLNKSFALKFYGRVLTIDSEKDLDKLAWAQFGFWFPQFKPLLKLGVHAVHLTSAGQRKTHLLFPRNLYAWDCETVYIMNPDCLSPI